MSFEDHFNWPAANRSNTMYLSTIKPNETGIERRTFFRERSPNLDISDIDKARPHYQGYQYAQKEIFTNRNDDIAGSRPKKLHQPLEKVYYALRNDDIVGAKPQCHKFVTARTPINPLNPEYKLPQVEIRLATPPKFVRDNIDIKDIDGARPNPYTKYNIQRKTNNVTDIDGARPKKEWLPQGKQSTLDVRDINYFWEFHTKRHTDPLSPRYKVVNDENKLVEYGQVDNKVMVRHPKEVNKVTSADLNTADIEGAQAGTSTQHVNKLETRDTFMKTKDIPGAQTTTLRKGMTTTRHLDPLWPAYKFPGHTEPPPVYTKNLKPSNSTQNFGIKTASDFASIKNNLVSPTGSLKDVAEKRVEMISSQNGIGQNAEPSGEKSQGGNVLDRKVVSPLARTAEEILNGDKNKNFGGRSEYVPARITSQDNVGNSKPRNGGTAINLETKKALNSNDTYQKNVKSFFGVANTDENMSFKPTTVAEKFDKFISK